MDYSKIYEKLLSTHAFFPYFLGRAKALPPLRVQIELTGRCNLKCDFCYQGKAYKDGENELSFEEVIRIIDQVPRYSLLTLSGGEPLLKNRINEILDYAISRHYCNIITNAVLLSQDISKLLVKGKLFLINVSIDGIGAIHDELRGVPGTFNKVKENLLLLREYKQRCRSKAPLVDVKTLVNSKNIFQLIDLYKFCEEVGAEFLTLSLPKNNDIQFNGTILYEDLNNDVFHKDYPANNNLDARQLITTLEILDNMKGKVRVRYYPRFEDYRLIESYFRGSSRKPSFYYLPCCEPWSGLQINAQGKAYPCLAYCVGDARMQSLKGIWNSKCFIEFRKRLKRIKLFPACSGCCYLKIRRKNERY